MPLGEIGANFSLQLSSRTQFTKINNKKVIPKNQCEKHKKSSLVVVVVVVTAAVVSSAAVVVLVEVVATAAAVVVVEATVVKRLAKLPTRIFCC